MALNRSLKSHCHASICIIFTIIIIVIIIIAIIIIVIIITIIISIIIIIIVIRLDFPFFWHLEFQPESRIGHFLPFCVTVGLAKWP